MRFVPSEIPDVVVIEPEVHSDSRGFFLETWNQRRFEEAGLSARFVQDNHSKSGYGVLRGLHLQTDRPQGKLVRVLRGEIFDVAVDVRPESPTFGRFSSARLSDANFKQLWIPPGFAHGFCVVTETAEVEYKCTDFHHPESELTILWSDPEIGIPWPVEQPILSAKDRAGIPLEAAKSRLRAL